MHARRTTAAGTSAALATASAMTPSSAPCRSPPVSRSAMKSISAGVARAEEGVEEAARAPTDPAPVVPASSLSARSSSVDGDPADSSSRTDRPGFSGRSVPETSAARPGGRRPLGEGGPADADPALAGLADQEADGRFDLVGVEPAEEVGQRGDLGAAGRRGRHPR